MKEKERTRNKRYCFQYVAATFFNNSNRVSSILTTFYTKSVCCFSPLQTLSLIYHLFSFPTTHFPLIALKPTVEKDSFCLLPLVFDRLYKRLFQILCEDITLNHLLFFLSLSIGHNRRRIGSIRVRSTRSADFSYPLQRHYSLSPSDFRLVGSVRTLDDPTQLGCIGQPYGGSGYPVDIYLINITSLSR